MKYSKILGLGLLASLGLTAIANQVRLDLDYNEARMNQADYRTGNLIPDQDTPEQPVKPQTNKKIKVALLLDTSNSMDGLIDQAKSQLWNIVNELAQAKVGEQEPDLQIALYQYGNSGLSSGSGYIRQETAFTGDLDLISEKLFALSTNGGEEYCGQVIQTSLKQLEWGLSSGDYKTIFIAGNEPFDQGSVSPKTALGLAKEKDVFVNAIYCGDRNAGISERWNIPLGQNQGEYMNIDANQRTVYVATPYDARIAELNQKLNETYVWYGSTGQTAYLNMNAQDNNASQYGNENYVNRAMMKNGRFYNNRNASWDLVDKLNTEKDFKVSSIKNEELPEEMRKMTDTQKLQYVEAKVQQRAAINKEIADLGQKRNNYIASEKAKLGDDASLENAMLAAIHDQAGSKGFRFENGGQASAEEFVPALVDFDYFLEVASEVKEYRKTRLVNFNTWLSMSKEPNTIILDTRSKAHYDAMHIAGAIHLNFSAFNVYDLARLIPDENTRILIYCNNNIDTDNKAGFTGIQSERFKQELQRNMVSKAYVPPIDRAQVLKLPANSYQGAKLDETKTLALNIPTFINLYGYGYKNVYELNELVKPNDPRLKLEGTEVAQ